MILTNLPILRYDSPIHMTAPRLSTSAKILSSYVRNQKSTPLQCIESLVCTNTPTHFSEHIDTAMQNYLFSDEIHKQSTTIAAIEWKKTIADIVNQTTSLSDNDQLMQLMELANFISQLSDEEIITLLNKRPTE